MDVRSRFPEPTGSQLRMSIEIQSARGTGPSHPKRRGPWSLGGWPRSPTTIRVPRSLAFGDRGLRTRATDCCGAARRTHSRAQLHSKQNQYK